MSFDYNKVLVAGRLSRDPEVKFFTNDKAVCNFSLAINEKYKNASGEKMENVTFVEVECWGRTAELVAQYLSKGRGCFIEGRLKLDLWVDKDGKKQQRLKISAESVKFTDSNPAGNAGNADNGGGSHSRSGDRGGPTAPRAVAPLDDEPPF